MKFFLSAFTAITFSTCLASSLGQGAFDRTLQCFQS